MGKIKIYEIAKKLGLASKEVLEAAEKLNIEVKSHMSGVGEEEAKKIEERLSNRSAKPEKTVKPEKTAKQATQKKEEKAPVIIRREVIIADEENQKKENKKEENKKNKFEIVERKQNKDSNIVYRNKPNKPKTVNELFGLNKPEPKKEKTEEIKKTEPVKEEKIIKEEIKEQGDSNLTMQAEVAEKRNVTQDNKFKNKNANN